jgi:hypothetical protein
MTEELIAYLRTATEGASNRAMADKVGLVHTTLASQLRAPETPASTLVALCRVYGIPLGEAFVAAGYITEEEARTFSGPLVLASINEIDLSKEMLRRVVAGSASRALTEPISEEVLNDVVREAETAREQKTKSAHALAAEDRVDRTPGEFGSDEARPEL